MGDQRERNRIKSRVDELPDEIRAQLDTMLADVNYTYQDIADTITDLGYEISRSAVGRYAMRHNSAARRLKEASGSGISIAKDTLEPLIGQGADPDLYARIMKEVASYEGIVGTHDLIVHNYGPGRSMASIHAEVPRDVDIEVSHDIIDRIEHEVGEKLGILLVIHMDPVEIHDATVLATKEKVRNVISILDPELSFHDFRMISGAEKKKLIFDLEIPYSYKKKDCDRVIGQIGALMKEMDEKYECVVNIDKKYVAGE